MKHITVVEYGEIERATVNPRYLRCLQEFDERSISKYGGGAIFDWSLRHVVKAKNLVGVIQVADLSVEILPKIDRSRSHSSSECLQLAQRNLLYMLSYSEKIPILERDLALLGAEQMPLLEALIKIFAERLMSELKKGLEHTYIGIENNLTHLRGKLLLCEHIRKNIVHKERLYVTYDEFIVDTWMNKILKGVTRKLLLLSTMVSVQKRLREILILLSDVEDVYIQNHHFANISFSRNTERFRTLVDFCRFIVGHLSPSPGKGRHNTFSLLFPMEDLFETFIASIVVRHSPSYGIARSRVHPQAAGRSSWLLRKGAKGKYRLRPDIIIDGDQKEVTRIVDTKWKHLKSDDEDSKNGVSQSDIYQLYAYANHYDCTDNLLLFPRVDGVTSKEYVVSRDDCKKLRVDYVDLYRDLKKERQQFIDELFAVLLGSKMEVRSGYNYDDREGH